MKTVIWIILVFVIIFFVVGCCIEWRPFRLHFDSWMSALGLALVYVGIVLISVGNYREGVRRGCDVAIETIEKFCDKNLTEK